MNTWARIQSGKHCGLIIQTLECDTTTRLGFYTFIQSYNSSEKHISSCFKQEYEYKNENLGLYMKERCKRLKPAFWWPAEGGDCGCEKLSDWMKCLWDASWYCQSQEALFWWLYVMCPSFIYSSCGLSQTPLRAAIRNTASLAGVVKKL